MFNIKGNLKEFYSVDYCNEILSMNKTNHPISSNSHPSATAK